MQNQVMKIETSLLMEMQIYQEIYNIEEKKSEAIVNKDGRSIEKLLLNQEKFINEITLLENQRESYISQYITENRLLIENENITLKKILLFMDDNSAEKLTLIGMELKNLLIKLKNLQQNNNRMIKDNIKFYNLFLEGIKDLNKINTGYGSTGKEQGKIANPVLFNQTA